MNKLNWRDASKELPKYIKEATFECLVVVGKIEQQQLTKCITSSFFQRRDDYFYWTEVGDEEIVLYWLPLNEIPLPEEEL